MTGIFFDGDTKNFQSNFPNLAQKILCFFFNRKSNFVRKQTVFEKKFLHAKFNILCA